MNLNVDKLSSTTKNIFYIIGVVAMGTIAYNQIFANQAAIVINKHDVNIDIEQLEIEDHEDGTFTTKLPKTQLDVRFRLLVGRDEKGLVNAIQSARQRKGPENNVTRQLANMIVAVNEDSSADAINYLINNIPSLDSMHLRMAYKLAAPNVDVTQYYECEECE